MQRDPLGEVQGPYPYREILTLEGEAEPQGLYGHIGQRSFLKTS